GIAAAELLDTFEAERGPVGRANISLALERYRDQAAGTGLVFNLAPGQGVASTTDGLAEDLGYVYGSSALAADDGTDPVVFDRYAADARPGARGPHAGL